MRTATVLTSLFVCATLSCIGPADAVEPAGAEVDDAATIAARAKVGTGPAAGFVADRRVKTSINEVGRLKNGVPVYSFKYLWDDRVRVGVLAQDLLEREDTKGAVLTHANGLLGVDYAMLGLRLATLAQWEKSGLSALKASYKSAADAKALQKISPVKRDLPVMLYNKRVTPVAHAVVAGADHGAD